MTNGKALAHSVKSISAENSLVLPEETKNVGLVPLSRKEVFEVYVNKGKLERKRIDFIFLATYDYISVGISMSTRSYYLVCYNKYTFLHVLKGQSSKFPYRTFLTGVCPDFQSRIRQWQGVFPLPISAQGFQRSSVYEETKGMRVCEIYQFLT